jgi:probable HAF family extracellular repeat protein
VLRRALSSSMYENDTTKAIDAMRHGGNSAAWGINDAGHIVGWTGTVDGSGAFLYGDGRNGPAVMQRGSLGCPSRARAR